LADREKKGKGKRGKGERGKRGRDDYPSSLEL
jgi:hypothetical protein